ncbi:hypothetical protein C8R45DRAFT_921794 [Mycena sanguinolenta]|nr:hypothetical protein C8R45DRAFT_921794 [Mycena sanguinolenta]
MVNSIICSLVFVLPILRPLVPFFDLAPPSYRDGGCDPATSRLCFPQALGLGLALVDGDLAKTFLPIESSAQELEDIHDMQAQFSQKVEGGIEAASGCAFSECLTYRTSAPCAALPTGAVTICCQLIWWTSCVG